MWNRFKKTFLGDAAFYRRIMWLALPMIAQNAITSFVSFADNIMVGRLGTEPMSGVAIVNQLLFVFNICIFGGVSGAGIFGTQFFGKGDHQGHQYTFRFKIAITLLLSTLALLLFACFNTELISLYLHDTGEVGDVELALQYGESYLAIMMLSLIPFAICQAYVSTIRETGQTFIPMIASVIAVLSNLVLDYLLIFGIGPLPAMGVKGAAVATVIARIMECVIVIVWTHGHKEKNPYITGAYRSLRIPWNISRDILIKGTPLMINEMLWATGMTVLVQCYSVRGLDVVAAQNIASTINNLFNIVFIQLGACISIVVGQYLGAGELEKAKDADNKMIFFSVVCCAVVALVMALVGGFFPEIYKTEDSIKELAKDFILIAATAMPLCAFSHATYFTLRSGGKTIITFLFDSVYTWVLVVPYAFYLANYTMLPITTVVFLVQFTEIVKVVIGFFMVRSNIWLNNIVDAS